MKRIVALALCLVVMASGMAFAEGIYFRDLQWGIPTVEMEQLLGGSSSSSSGVCAPTWEECDVLSESATTHVSNPNSWETVTSYGDDPLIVAGYKVLYIDSFALYGLDGDMVLEDKDKSRFYIGEYVFDVINEIDDVQDAYEILNAKLESLYGAGKHESIRDVGELTETYGTVQFNIFRNQTIWYGDNDTAIILYACDNDYEGQSFTVDVYNRKLQITYINTGMSEYLKSLDEAISKNLQAGEEAFMLDTDGL